MRVVLSLKQAVMPTPIPNIYIPFVTFSRTKLSLLAVLNKTQGLSQLPSSRYSWLVNVLVLSESGSFHSRSI